MTLNYLNVFVNSLWLEKNLFTVLWTEVRVSAWLNKCVFAASLLYTIAKRDREKNYFCFYAAIPSTARYGNIWLQYWLHVYSVLERKWLCTVAEIKCMIAQNTVSGLLNRITLLWIIRNVCSKHCLSGLITLCLSGFVRCPMYVWFTHD